ncbi:metalloregulator ArsR/SmtB family transcription factor [Leptobacterium sp. I13]|uniref:ArsR/SmtB family transcription factor n=1 Tax=Leptobacterium meishanense TaxID=3128904 RepID=UPI0030EF542D
MGVTKSEIYTLNQNKLAEIAKAIGHPARIAILQHIIKSNSCICGDLVGEIGLAQPTISQHLKELKNIGIIKGTVEGTSICYCIHEENWEAYRSMLTTFLDSYQTSCTKENCC